jgi:hypothetical protein
MSKFTIIVLIYHRHKRLDLILSFIHRGQICLFISSDSQNTETVSLHSFNQFSSKWRFTVSPVRREQKFNYYLE